MSSTQEELSTNKPLYSHVLSSPRFALGQSQNYRSPSSTDSEHDHSYSDFLENPGSENYKRETFQIDRRKLEKLIQSSNDSVLGINDAEYFFNKIMKATETFILWPRNLTIGARTRKDPFINVIGKRNDINWAKGLILARLAVKGPLIRMKMIIAENDHSYVIGRNGNNVKSIKERTDTHIHFPDSNRRKYTEKSNKVSLYGPLEGLERARRSLRGLIPLVMSFELPLGNPVPKHNSPDIKQLEDNFGVKVTFLAVPNKTSYLAIVKGTEEIADKLKEAVDILVNITCGPATAYTRANIRLEFLKNIFDLLSPEQKINLKELQDRTLTKISIPDSSDEEAGEMISITGPIEMIHEVQKEIFSHLPIELTFDVPEHLHQVSEILNLGNKYGISISIRHKEKDKTIVITMAAEEQIIANIYEALEEIIAMQNTSRDEIEFPKAYFLVEPSYRKVLEKNINSGSQYDYELTRKIWAPIEPNVESNFLYIDPSIYPNENPNQFEQREVLSSTSLSPGHTCSSRGSSHPELSSEDWSLMRSVHNDDQHYECDFDSEDMEVALIFMSSTSNSESPVFQNAPGAERLCRT